MAKIIGGTTATPMLVPDWNQTNPKRADYIKNKPDLDSMFGRTSSQINKLDKRVTNLEQGILPSPFVTDYGMAYQKAVPSNALPFAEVEKIGGMTRKCTNLIPFPYTYTDREYDGITWKVNADGSVTANGTATETTIFVLANYSVALSKGTYTLSGIPANGSNTTFMIQTANLVGTFALNNISVNGNSFTLDTDTDGIVFQLVIFSGYTANNLVFKPMLNRGDTALPYEPYFEGLRSASVTEVESVGANLFDFAEKTTTASGYIFRGLFLPQRIKAGTYTFSFRAKNYTPTNQFQCTFLNSKGVIIADSNGVFINETCIFTFTITEEAVVVELYVNSTIGGTFYDFMLNKGETALPYTPYREPVALPIPSAVQALDGYGWGINESVYNYIDWEKKQFVKRVEKVVFDGSADENWNKYLGITLDGVHSYYIEINNRKIGIGLTLCDKFTFGENAWDRCGAMYYCDHPALVNVYFNSDLATVEGFRTWLSNNPTTLYYELATPIITDISNLITEDNYIGVEGGGTITMVNEHQYAVPSSINYKVKGEA